MALLDLFGFVIDETLFFFIVSVIGFLVGLVVIIWKRSNRDEGPVTEAWEYEESGATWPCQVTGEDAAYIDYDVQYSRGMDPVHRHVKHGHPWTLIATGQRVFKVPRGSEAADDPRNSFDKGIDQDEPEPLIQASASFYNRLAQLMGGAGLKLRENWFTILMIAIACLGAGIILEAKFLLVPVA